MLLQNGLDTFCRPRRSMQSRFLLWSLSFPARETKKKKKSSFSLLWLNVSTIAISHRLYRKTDYVVSDLTKKTVTAVSYAIAMSGIQNCFSLWAKKCTKLLM